MSTLKLSFALLIDFLRIYYSFELKNISDYYSHIQLITFD